MADSDELIDELAKLALFADLDEPQLRAVAHIFEEAWYAADTRLLRQGIGGSGFYVILEGEVAVVIDGEERARLTRGDYFGEVAILLGERPVADVVAQGPLRVLHLAGQDLHSFLLTYPRVTYRVLVEQTRRLRNANRWRR
ncbi:MAG TPA: cyclic nucleotide-binding domain-containing protein [Candidatus Dormibacteraeota bacterium]|nr:cyclic nucleotide-binding domain-containing protein [Candidatus Dormibacteraeota bacterium]